MRIVDDLLPKLVPGESTSVASAGSRQVDLAAFSTLLLEAQLLHDAGVIAITNRSDSSVTFTLIQALRAE
jgi:hypothetical protein